MFKCVGNKGFQMTFENGNTVSVQWGPSNYCTPLHEGGRFARYDLPMKMDGESWKSNDAEVAEWDKDNNWHHFEYDQVRGYISTDEVVQFMGFVATSILNTEDPDWKKALDDDDESEDENDEST